MHTIRQSNELQKCTTQLRSEGKTIGFIPTMGALHDGHISLVSQSKKENDVTIVSIFVNPAQFTVREDLGKYPRPFEKDVALLEEIGADLLFYPSVSDIYPKGYATYTKVNGISDILEGKIRPSHFEGVVTVVLKLFHLTQPNNAYFGQKDFQQCVVIKQMIRDVALPIQVQVMPTVREADGVAMSSRNVYLSPAERKEAVCLFETLQFGQKLVQDGGGPASEIDRKMREFLKQFPLFRLEYLEFRDVRTFTQVDHVNLGTVMLLAGKIGKTRLLDNWVIQNSL